MRSPKTATEKKRRHQRFQAKESTGRNISARSCAISGALRASVRTPPVIVETSARIPCRRERIPGLHRPHALDPPPGVSGDRLLGLGPALAGSRTSARRLADGIGLPVSQDLEFSEALGRRASRARAVADASGSSSLRDRTAEMSDFARRAPRDPSPDPAGPARFASISRALRHLPRRALPRGDRPVDRPRRARGDPRGGARDLPDDEQHDHHDHHDHSDAWRVDVPLRLRGRVSRGAPDVTIEIIRVGVGERPAGVPVRGSAWTRDDRDHHHARDGTVDASRPRCRFDPFARAVDIAETAAVLACVAAADDGSGSGFRRVNAALAFAGAARLAVETVASASDASPVRFSFPPVAARFCDAAFALGAATTTARRRA